MKRILILGSAPHAQIPMADVVYCANSAAYYHADRLDRDAEVNCVVGSHIIAAVADSEAPDAVRKARETIFSMGVDAYHCLDHNPWYPGWDLEQGLLELKDKSNIQVKLISRRKRAETLLRTSGLAEPIFSNTLWIEALRMKPRRFIKSFRSLRREATKRQVDSNKETHEVLRPSTGMVAATLAMDTHGSDAEYVFSGIGLSIWSDRTLHPGGISQGSFRDFVHHKHADIQVLKALGRKYQVRCLPSIQS